ncbi:Zn-ribbon domain-containing OB-fold protein [Nocardia alni]|uniref:Zn-ribbon domain-containing OB-fold protein n=1 Tax=Nocardia alni TaxID=2815723 RepID=UPI001C220102|nr:OB-fold domain-containing protein [Nocardia alni]
MPPARSAQPAWFDAESTRLIGKACARCGSLFFPPTVEYCRNPRCGSAELQPQPLAHRGTVWSWTRNHYRPPAPYVSTDPFEPYVVLAVELEHGGLTVLGQLSPLSAPVEVGDAVTLCTEQLLEDEDGIQLVWRWTREVSEQTGVTA